MLAPYKPSKVFDAQLTLEVWLRLVADEQLYDAMLAGRHGEAARARGMSDEEILVLDDLCAQPGTRWHVENLRFRCTTMVARVIQWHLPGTVQLLTRGSDDWMRDLAFEYLAYHQWKDLGHHQRFAECQRFAGFVRQRIAKRRRPPEHLETVLGLELAALELLRAAAQVPPDAWPVTGEVDVAGLRPRRGPVHQVVELAVDILDWLERPEGEPRAAGGPVAALLWVPSLADAHRIMRLDPPARAMFEALDGERTIDSIAREIGQPDLDLVPLVRRWLEEGAVVS